MAGGKHYSRWKPSARGAARKSIGLDNTDDPEVRIPGLHIY